MVVATFGSFKYPSVCNLQQLHMQKLMTYLQKGWVIKMFSGLAAHESAEVGMISFSELPGWLSAACVHAESV